MNKEQFTFEQDDILHRKQYAESIVNIISYISKNKTEGSYVISLDSKWGTGKTTFVKKMMPLIEEKSFKVVYYNAWEHDYMENPFLSLYAELVESNIGELSYEHLTEGQCDIIKHLIKGFSLDLASHYGLESTFRELHIALKRGKHFFNSTDEIKEACQSARKDMELFREHLKNAVGKNKNQIVVIVDELDRCKPIFAIKTLEIIKHLFDIPGIYFILSVDFQQLKHSISTIYGQGMDSEGYLMRFVDHIIKLPAPKAKYYVKFLQKNSSVCKIEDEKVIDALSECADLMNLSYRDIDRIYNSIAMLYMSHPRYQHNIDLLHPYIPLILFKYKIPVVYERSVREGKIHAKAVRESLKMNEDEYEMFCEIWENIDGARGYNGSNLESLVWWEFFTGVDSLDKYEFDKSMVLDRKQTENYEFVEVTCERKSDLKSIYISFIAFDDIEELEKKKENSLLRYMAGNMESFLAIVPDEN